VSRVFLLSPCIALTFRSSPSDIRVPTSLAYHLADIYLEELNKALSSTPSPPPAPIHTLLQPFVILAAQTSTSVTYKRIQSVLFDPLFFALSPPLEDQPRSHKRIRLMDSDTETYPHLIANACYEDPKSEGKVGGPLLRKMLLQSLFKVASQPETRNSNRRKMYTLWKEANEGDDGDEAE
jgi:ribosomal RNA-processing protein 1